MLICHTYFSFHYGTVSPEESIGMTKSGGYNTVVIADIMNTSAVLSFVRLAQKAGIRTIPGVDFRDGVSRKFVAIARNNKGFYEINRYLSQLLHDKTPPPGRAPEFANVLVFYPAETYSGFPLRTNEYIGISAGFLHRLPARKHLFPAGKLVMMHTASFRNSHDHNTHRLLRAIGNNTLLSKLPRSEEGPPADRYLPLTDLTRLYSGFPELIHLTGKLFARCSFHFDFGENAPHRNLKHYTGSADADRKLIRNICMQNMAYRYPGAGKEVYQRIDKELKIIEQKNYIAYFLVAWDIVSYARSKGYFYVGRGSGANSIVAYLLRITDVDPIELDLYFERFINLFRKNPPDFDIDFSWKDRPDITRYIFHRFGSEHTALLGTHVSFQYRAAVRELGKVFGLPKREIDLLGKGRFNYDRLDKLSQLVIRYARRIRGLPRHISVHTGGIIISEKPMHCFTATMLPPKGFRTTHFDMITAEDAGLYKFDILGQRGLGKIKDAVDIVAKNRPGESPVDIHDIARFKRDEKIKALLRKGQTIGCFYVESPAMRMLLNKLRVDDYLGLVAASSIIRPGVAKSGMMREYIMRFRYPERRKEAHPVLLDIMPETFGVMVYQEDVIKVAHLFAGLSLSEADILRRGMSGKYRSRDEFRAVREKFFANCRKKGYPEQLTTDVWRQIESFAGYAFAKGHSASYAVESYQSLYLKAHYPLEYMVAVINNGGGFYRPEIYLHEARMNGGHIHLPCINRSHYHTTLSGNDIYLGFHFIRDMESRLAWRITDERKANGPFRSFGDFIDRVPVTVADIENLIRINGFRFTGKPVYELLWTAHLLTRKDRASAPGPSLFAPSPKNYAMPDLSPSETEALFDQIEILGFPANIPVSLLECRPDNELRASNLPAFKGKTVTITGYLVTVKNTTTSRGKHMQFGTFLDLDGRFIDTVHFPPVVAKQPLRSRGFYNITGKVVEEFEFYSIEVSRIIRLPLISDPRYDESPGLVS